MNQYQTKFPGTCTILKKPSAPVFIILSVILIFQSCSVAPRYTVKHPEEKRKTTPPSEKKSKPFDEKIRNSKKPQSGGLSSDEKEEPAEKSSETPAQNPEVIFQQTGLASYYANNLQGHRTANGERYDKSDFTAAHLTLPFNTMVKVTNIENDLSVKVRINDRGPHSKARIIDLSRVAAEQIGLIRKGICKVRIEKVE